MFHNFNYPAFLILTINTQKALLKIVNNNQSEAAEDNLFYGFFQNSKLKLKSNQEDLYVGFPI